ncbi:hypothetical protein TGAM01_v203533 [Trichoderma gamsii]|uniref:Uncharacterized protein n=1 Tax=Trichoderma gamsii TaxID=398673 RepID=A0A2P4ZTZ5_9HYPO|nr:hypothetical protein TGAM01_v203533 [Trichoderma gamsii]PON27766.1 hypothetical protein TGAM01_v203533 [Trichoderma gamsii]
MLKKEPLHRNNSLRLVQQNSICHFSQAPAQLPSSELRHRQARGPLFDRTFDFG